MLNCGIYLAPAQFEALFVSTAHSKEDLDRTIKAHRESLLAMLSNLKSSRPLMIYNKSLFNFDETKDNNRIWQTSQ